jgi:hypothetical protein
MVGLVETESDCLRFQPISISSNVSVTFSNMSYFVAIKVTKISCSLSLWSKVPYRSTMKGD